MNEIEITENLAYLGEAYLQGETKKEYLQYLGRPDNMKYGKYYLATIAIHNTHPISESDTLLMRRMGYFLGI